MSNENNSSIGSAVVSYVAFPALFSAKHIKNAVKYHRNGDLKLLKELEETLKGKTDVFQRTNILTNQYEALASAQKIPFKQKFLNIFIKKANKFKRRTFKNGRHGRI